MDSPLDASLRNGWVDLKKHNVGVNFGVFRGGCGDETRSKVESLFK